MKSKIKVPRILWVLILCAAALFVCWQCSEPYVSTSAVLDLQEELERIYGSEYTGKAVKNGTEDMVFVIEPKTRFLTNWDLRNALGLDYEYECQVIITTYAADGSTAVRTITYQAFDPMGTDKLTTRAALVPDSRREQVD